MAELQYTVFKKLVPTDQITKHSVQNDDVGASIVFAVMQLNKTEGCGDITNDHRADFIEVIKNGALISYPPGATIIRKGATDDCLYVILEGSVCVEAPDGKKITLDKGSLVGQMAPLIDEPRNATVVAGESLVSALVVRKETLFANPSVYRCLLGNGLVISGKTGNYELGVKLGEGMTSKVYAVRGERYCAKVYKNVLRYEGDYVAKFIAENFLDLKHPHIVNVYELIEAYGAHFIIMDWAKGVSIKKKTGEVVKCLTLRHLIKVYREEGQRLAVDLVFRMFSQIGAALLHTHQHGYVHRDIKPDNIFLDVRENQIAFMLADFGLALHINTRPEKIAGTPQYMPPEAVDIENTELTLGGTADFYSFAAVCYEMLTGERLFKGTNILELVRQHLYEEPDLSRLPADIPKTLRQFIERSLRKSPEDRPTADEVGKYIRQQ
jgi:serine/threonine-protein kinase